MQSEVDALDAILNLTDSKPAINLSQARRSRLGDSESASILNKLPFPSNMTPRRSSDEKIDVPIRESPIVSPSIPPEQQRADTPSLQQRRTQGSAIASNSDIQSIVSAIEGAEARTEAKLVAQRTWLETELLSLKKSMGESDSQAVSLLINLDKSLRSDYVESLNRVSSERDELALLTSSIASTSSQLTAMSRQLSNENALTIQRRIESLSSSESEIALSLQRANEQILLSNRARDEAGLLLASVTAEASEQRKALEADRLRVKEEISRCDQILASAEAERRRAADLQLEISSERTEFLAIKEKEGSRITSEWEKLRIAKREAELVLEGIRKRAEAEIAVINESRKSIRAEFNSLETQRRELTIEMERFLSQKERVDIEKLKLQEERDEIEQQTKDINQKSVDAAEAFRKAKNAKEEVLAICEEVKKQKENVLNETEKLNQIQNWIEHEKSNLVKAQAGIPVKALGYNGDTSFVRERPLSRSAIDLSFDSPKSLRGAIIRQTQEESAKWQQVRKEAEAFDTSIADIQQKANAIKSRTMLTPRMQSN